MSEYVRIRADFIYLLYTPLPHSLDASFHRGDGGRNSVQHTSAYVSNELREMYVAFITTGAVPA